VGSNEPRGISTLLMRSSTSSQVQLLAGAAFHVRGSTSRARFFSTLSIDPAAARHLAKLQCLVCFAPKLFVRVRLMPPGVKKPYWPADTGFKIATRAPCCCKTATRAAFFNQAPTAVFFAAGIIEISQERSIPATTPAPHWG